MKNTPLVRALLCAPLALCIPVLARPDVDRPRAAPLISAVYAQVPLRDALQDLARRCGTIVHPLYADDADPDGLDPEALVTATLTRAPLGSAIDALLLHCECEAASHATWQRAESGAVEVGTRAALNRRAYTRIYDIQDLTMPLPRFTSGATLDLPAALAKTPGSVLREDPQSAPDSPSPVPPIRQLRELITSTIEPDQWQAEGGQATIAEFRGCLVVHAPGYIHRQIDAREARPD